MVNFGGLGNIHWPLWIFGPKFAQILVLFFLIELNNFSFGTLSCASDSFKDAPEEYNFFKKNPFQICQFFNPGEQIK